MSKVSLCKGGPACSLNWACVKLGLLAVSIGPVQCTKVGGLLAV